LSTIRHTLPFDYLSSHIVKVHRMYLLHEESSRFSNYASKNIINGCMVHLRYNCWILNTLINMNHDLEENLSEDGFFPLGQFHQGSMSSFYARRSRKRNNSVKSSVSFYSARVGSQAFGLCGQLTKKVSF